MYYDPQSTQSPIFFVCLNGAVPAVTSPEVEDKKHNLHPVYLLDFSHSTYRKRKPYLPRKSVFWRTHAKVNQVSETALSAILYYPW